MQNKPLVSVVIPTYSRPQYLKRCIESVLNQTYENIEIFIVDDNNPDTEFRFETEQVMNEYINNRNITYLKHEKNKNGSAARNTGWRQAKGKYITYIDDDDELSELKIQCQVECLEKLDDSWGACYTGYSLIKSNGKYQTSSVNRSGDCYIYALMRTMFMGSGSNLLLRKSVVDLVNGYDESFKRNQDIEFLVRVLEHKKIAYVDEVLLTIYQEGNRVVRSFEELDGYAKYYIDRFSERIEALDKKDKLKVMSVISLERARVAIAKKEASKAVDILVENKVSFSYICKYVIYIIYRCITHKSFGFDGSLSFPK